MLLTLCIDELLAAVLLIDSRNEKSQSCGSPSFCLSLLDWTTRGLKVCWKDLGVTFADFSISVALTRTTGVGL